MLVLEEKISPFFIDFLPLLFSKLKIKYVWFFLEDENEDFIAASEVEAFDGQFSYVFKNENVFYSFIEKK